jgi:hypothetical protein
MQGNAVIAVIIGGLTAMGLLLWGLSSWWLSLQRKWAEDLKARQDRQATTERAGQQLQHAVHLHLGIQQRLEYTSHRRWPGQPDVLKRLALGVQIRAI